MRKCIVCDNEVSADSAPPAGSQKGLKCPACNADLGKAELCATCQKPMPPGAKVCNECKSYRNLGLRYLFQAGAALTQFVAFLAIISNIILTSSLLDRESHTRFKVAGVDSEGKYIYLKVWNSGKTPSALKGYRLRFGPYPQNPAVLALTTDDVRAAQNVVKGEDIEMIKLVGGTLRFPGLKEGVLPRLRESDVTLEIDVEESNDPGFFGRRFHTLREKFSEGLIGRFVEVRLQ